MRHDDLPKWFLGLVAARTADDWLAALFDVDEAAFEGLLRRTGLPVAELRTDRADEVRRALASGLLTLDRLSEWRDHDLLDAFDAIESIGDFRQRWPLVNKFAAQERIPTGGGLESALQEIRNRIWAGSLPLRTLLAFFDPLRETTDRDLFLGEIERPQLDRLRDTAAPGGLPGTLLRRLRDRIGIADPFPWRPPEPTLTDADVDDEETVVLRLRFVGMRVWPSPDGTINQKRCVTFSRIDVETGRVELQLPHVEAGGMHGLAEERDVYLRILAELLEAPLRTIRLEPAMRTLMGHPSLTLDSWRVRLPTGGVLTGKLQSDLFDKVKPGFDRYYALALAGEWLATDERTVSIRMDARTDALTIREQCEPSIVDDLVALVRERADAALEEAPRERQHSPGQPPKLESTPGYARFAELQALLEKLVARQRRLGRIEMKVDDLGAKDSTSDLLANAATLQEALDRVGVRHMGATLYVICPRTLSPVQQAGRDAEFERLADVPKEILCENEPGGPQLHPTEGNIWLRVGHTQPTISFLVIYVAWMAFLLFIALATWFFAWLWRGFPDQGAIILGGWLVSLIAPVVAIMKIYGPDNVKAAVKILETIGVHTQKTDGAGDDQGAGAPRPGKGA